MNKGRLNIGNIMKEGPIYCPNCGEKLDDDAVFCPNCGCEIKQQEDPKAKRNKLKWPHLDKKTACVIAAYAIILMYIFALNKEGGVDAGFYGIFTPAFILGTGFIYKENKSWKGTLLLSGICLLFAIIGFVIKKDSL